ncbi:MAG: DUF2797 domain-containing protein [Candidatus Aenigmatarchaeota archaeon]
MLIVNDFRWRKTDDEYEPELVIKNGSENFVIPLIYNSLNFSIGDRYCIGYTRNNMHFDCPKNNKVENSFQCEICKKLDDTLPCTSCTGICRNFDKRQECMEKDFCIYIALFGNLLKVGISQEQRVKHRLIEQGADFGAVIAKIKDGKLARIYEQKIKDYLNIEDRVSGYKKFLKSYVNPINSIKTIVEAVNKIKQDEKLKINIENFVIYDLRKYYNLDAIENVKPNFIKIKKEERMEGIVIAVKGNIIFMKRNHDYICFNANDLKGREIFGIL